MSTPPLFTTSFESPYVSLDLLSYLKSKQVTPFQIFNEVIMPGFLHQISKEKLPPQGNSSSTTTTTIITNGDGIVEEDSSWQDMMEEIRNDLTYIRKACGECEEWEMAVNSAIKYLSYQALDDAFKERTEAPDERTKADSRHKKLKDTRDCVSRLKKTLYSHPPLSSVNNSASFQRAKRSMDHHSANLPTQVQDVNIDEEIRESPTFKKIEAVYNELDETSKLCFLCFSVFPENAVIKKKVLVHWWVGEEFIDTLVTQGKTAEDIASEYFKVFIAKGLIKPVYTNRRPSADSCYMEPSTRDVVIKRAKEAHFFNFDTDGNPTEDFTCSKRACLVKTGEGSSIRELPYRLEQESVLSLINVNEPNLDFRPEWFSKMKNVKVLQLGRWESWESSAKHLIQVEDGEDFLKGLKNMRHLRYLSLRGVSRITKLPASICKLSNLRILNLNGCGDLEQLPRGIGSLKSLTYLDMYECYLLSHMPKGLASLKQLQVLKGFVIGEPRPGRQYCKLADLSRLENLRKLSIHVDIKSMPGAAERDELICLKDFKMLRSLSISWSRLYGTPKKPATLQRTVTKKTATLHSIVIKKAANLQRIITKKLASLTKQRTKLPASRSQPPLMAPTSTASIAVRLEKLNLHYVPGSEIPDWLMRWELLNGLEKLSIRHGNLLKLCHGKKCQLTAKTVRLKSLEKLQMSWREMQELFPNLTYLEIFECQELISSIPCDENGVWVAADSKQETA